MKLSAEVYFDTNFTSLAQQTCLCISTTACLPILSFIGCLNSLLLTRSRFKPATLVLLKPLSHTLSYIQWSWYLTLQFIFSMPHTIHVILLMALFVYCSCRLEIRLCFLQSVKLLLRTFSTEGTNHRLTPCHDLPASSLD